MVDETDHVTPRGFSPAVVKTVHQTQVMTHVAMPINVERNAGHPHTQRQRRQRSHRRHPEPDKQKDLLVEKVDRKHTLDRVPLHVGQSANTEVAEGHAWKSRRRCPIVAGNHRPQNLDAEQVEILAKEKIQSEQLADDVDEKQQLDGQVDGNQVVAMTTTAEAETRACEEVLETDVT